MHIYKVDLSFLLGAKGREVILHAQKEGIMHPGQYKGLPGRYCTNIVILKEFRIDYSLLRRLDFKNMDTDLTSFYRRILCVVLSLTSRKY